MKDKKQIEIKSGWKPAIIIFFIVFLILFIYAIVRYNVFRGVSVSNIPLYISNKALAVASVVLIGLSFLLGPLAKFWPRTFAQKLYLRKYLGLFGFGIAAVHGIISLLIFNPSYYSRFFIEGKLTLAGELSMLFGILALFIFSIVAISSLPSLENTMDKKKWLFIQRLGYLAFFLVMLHVVSMGYKGWLTPSEWPGKLLPMSLITFIIIALVLLFRILSIFVKKGK